MSKIYNFYPLLMTAFSFLALTACQKDYSAAPKATNQNLSSKPALAAAATIGQCDYDLTESTLTSTGWTKIFEDNFTTNLSKWNAWYGGAYNNELQMYQAANCTLSNGILSINAVKQSAVGPTLPMSSTLSAFSYTSGRLESKTNFSASKTNPKVRIMARLKLPAGYGMWPAFWSYGDPWPTQGEIDIMEARGQEPYTFYTNYFYGRRAGVVLSTDATAMITSSVDLTTCWHVFELIWAQNSLTYLLDGQIVNTKTGGYISSLFGKTERITLNLAVGGGFFPNLNPANIQTGTFQVDWVKVFRAN